MRGIEYFSDALGVRLPATTNHDILVATDAAPLRKNLAEQVIRSQRNGELTQDFPLRIAAIDGKDLSTSRIDAGDYSMAQGGKFRNRAIRAMLVTSATKIFLGQHMIPGETTEKKVFLDFVDELLELYEDEPVFDVVSVDAGFASYKNFKGLQERGISYIMAIKNNIPTLYKLLLAVTDKPGETYDVDTIVHRGSKLRTHKNLVRSRAPYHKNWRGITEVWRVTQKTEYYCEVWDEWLPKETKTRIFITNVDPDKLDGLQVLEAVRAHWAVENNGYFTLDYTWKEDLKPIANRALELISLLRLLAYNEMSRFMSLHIKQMFEKCVPWKHIFQIVKMVLYEFVITEQFEFGALPQN